jgi:hypothetical protein
MMATMKKNISCVEGPRIAILMMNSPNIPKYAYYSTLINYTYATRYGYAFLVQRCPWPENIPTKDWYWGDGSSEYLLVWSKASVIKKFLYLYDYIVYLDSDAFVYDQSIPIEFLIKNTFDQNPSISLVTQEDCDDQHSCNTKGGMNAGVLIFKNCSTSFELLDEWMNQETKACKDFLYRHPREQQCLNIIKRQQDWIQSAVVIYPIQEIGGSDSSWIRHMMSKSSEYREKQCLDQLERMGIHFSSSSSSQENFTITHSETKKCLVLLIMLIVLIILITVLISKFRHNQVSRKSGKSRRSRR